MASSPQSPGGSSGPFNDSEKTAVISGDQETLKRELQRAKEQAACLIIIRGQPQGHRYFLTLPEMVIGRDANADIVATDQSISRKHAKLLQNEGKVTLTDLGSANGTYVNDIKLGPSASVVLEKEDMIKMGNSIYKYLPAGELEILFYGNLGSAAHTDPLTRIYNKGYLMEALDAEFKRAKALHNDFSLLFFDLDHFGKLNNAYGHEAGDYALKEFTSLVKAGHLRPKDVFARYGGEEFVVLLSNTGLRAATEFAERIRAAVESHAFIYEGKRMPVTTSIGVAELAAGIQSAQTLLKAADKALYDAKSNGRNRVSVSS